jgi:hypothetical protein
VTKDLTGEREFGSQNSSMRGCPIPTSRTKPTKSGRIFGGSTDLCASSNAIGDSDTAPISETAPRLGRGTSTAHGDPLGRQPVADLCALKIDDQNPIAPARKHDDRSARILFLRRIERHPRQGDFADPNPGPAVNQGLILCGSDLRPGDRPRIRRHPRPDRHWRMPSDGCQPGVCALRRLNPNPSQRAKEQRSKASSQSPQLRPVTATSGKSESE